MWERWRAGQSLSEIGRALGKSASSIQGFVGRKGGIRPAERQRDERRLSECEREQLSRSLYAGESLRAIARQLKRSPSTISREVARNGGREHYRAAEAEARALARSRRPKRCKLARYRRLRRHVARLLQRQWSPEQIAGWLRQTFPDDKTMHISHETIYRTLFIQARGALKKGLLEHLRTHRRTRRGKPSTAKGRNHGQIVDATSIRQRPAEVEDRAVPGHWEGDLISGTNNSHIATLVERKTRYVMLVKLKNRESKTVADALSEYLRRLPAVLRRSLTWDRGTEMAQHKRLSVAADLQIYFCDPRSPWQRGTNENTNGLLRQYFPKKTDLSQHSQSHLNAIARRLNERPRKTLGFISPEVALAKVLR